MMRTTVIVLAAAAMLGGCGKKAERRDVEKLVNDLWRSCVLVEAKDVKIESQDRKTVRYSYALRMRVNGNLAGKGVPCPMPAQKMAEMLFNKDMADLKVNDETTVTQEATKP
jgi:type II secretory ATPase GspE/PulE/Tfp pilus assembly ATPase PilB-like protein